MVCTYIFMILIVLILECVYSINLIKKASTTSLPDNKISTSRFQWELDQNAMISKSKFKIKPAALIERCKIVINNGIGLKNPNDLADDFQFIFPVVGPLKKGSILLYILH